MSFINLAANKFLKLSAENDRHAVQHVLCVQIADLKLTLQWTKDMETSES